jgi:hypothetical protein
MFKDRNGWIKLTATFRGENLGQIIGFTTGSDQVVVTGIFKSIQ